MVEPEERTQLLIGKLVLEQSALEKQIGKLRDEISRRARMFARIGQLLVSQPERLVFVGQTVGDRFAGEPVIDRKGMDVDSLISELRAAIIRKAECAVQLAEMGIDPDEDERERDLRASRALWNPANVGQHREDGKRRTVGFTKAQKKDEP